MNKRKANELKDLIVTVLLVLSSILLIFSMIARFGFDQIKNYIPFLVLIFLVYGLERRFYIINYKKEVQRFDDDLLFKEILFDILVELKDINLPREKVYEKILQAAIKALKNADRGSVMRIKGEKGKETIEFVAAEGFDMNILRRVELKLSETYLYRGTNGEMDTPVVVSNGDEFDEKYSKGNSMFDELTRVGMDNVKTSLVSPIIISGEVVGMINIDSDINNAFADDDIVKMQLFAYKISEAIENHENFKNYNNLTKYDQLTNVYNKGYFSDIHMDMHYAGNTMSYLFVVLDINDLYAINDEYGREGGDRAIKELANVMRKIVPDKAIVGRYGGGEFNILFPNYSEEIAKITFNTISDYINVNKLDIGDAKVDLTFEYGLSKYPGDSRDYDELIGLASRRLKYYKNKNKERRFQNK